MEDKWIQLYDDVEKNLRPQIVEGKFNKEYFLEYWVRLEKAYTENRHYHTLNHVNHILNAINEFELGNADRVLLYLTAFFHDIDMIMGNTGNETQSAYTFETFGRMIGMSYDDTITVKDCIIATDHKTPLKNGLEQIICDCDLKGFSSKFYIENSNYIKQEFTALNDVEWKIGRYKFLTLFLSKEHIYYTDLFREKYEELAQVHLMAELKYIEHNGMNDEQFKKSLYSHIDDMDESELREYTRRLWHNSQIWFSNWRESLDDYNKLKEYTD